MVIPIFRKTSPRIFPKGSTSLLAILALFLFAVVTTSVAGADATTGVVLLHAQGGSAKPSSPLGGLADALMNAGFAVLAPDMPWSETRILDRDYEASMDEIDLATAAIRSRGAQGVVVVGHGLGANAALGYAARREGLAGVILIAMDHIPGSRAWKKTLDPGIQLASSLVANGKPMEKTPFPLIFSGLDSTLTLEPSLYLSWFNPQGPAQVKKNATNLKPGTPVLWIIASQDVETPEQGPAYAFKLLPSHPKNTFLILDGSGVQAPERGRKEILDWLKEIAPTDPVVVQEAPVAQKAPAVQ